MPVNSWAFARPLTSVIWAMKISRISSCAGSTTTLSRAGSTFAAVNTCLPAASRISLTCPVATRLPATSMGQPMSELASLRAL